MKVVSVINYKGGVGKTTLTANLGAGLAQRGSNVLLIDLDPQASLTFSFFSSTEWREQLARDLTIKNWYDSPGRGKSVTKLSSLIVRPSKVNQHLSQGLGRGELDMIVSHQDLVTVDTLLAGAVDPKTREVPPSRFVKVFRRLAEGLNDHAFSMYDFVLIDCAPDFRMMNKNAVIASHCILIPSRPDYLSTNGINHFGEQLFSLIDEYNAHARKAGNSPLIPTPQTGVLFTMVDVWRGQPIDVQSMAINQIRALGAPVFKSFMRDRKTSYPVTPETGIPAMLTHRDAADEMDELITDFIKWTEGTPL